MAITSRATLPKSGKKAPRKSSSLPVETVEYLKAWMMSPEHIAHPYPTEPEKAKIMEDTGIELKQLTNWFVNNRKRYWKPRVEKRLQQQAQAAAAAAHAHAAAVAVATASVHTSPVSPEPGFKPLITPTVGNGFVTFDLVTSGTLPQQHVASAGSTKNSHPHLVETDLARVIADHQANAHRDSRVVSEASSSASITASEEGNLSDSSTNEEETVNGSIKTAPNVPQTQDLPQRQTQDTPEDSSYQQTKGEPTSSSSCTIVSTTSEYVSVSESETSSCSPKRVYEQQVQTPRKKFRRTSFELWRETCQNAGHVFDESLPSLEEATQLFGYSSSSQ